MKITNAQSTVDTYGNGSIETRQLDRGSTWEEGYVYTPHGIVAIVLSQGDAESAYITRLDFIHRGHVYSRTMNARYSKRGLVTVAKRYAAEIAG